MKDIQIAKPMLLPPPKDHCRICAVKHEPNMAHDASSLFFQMRFRMRYGRDGTWADAIAHLSEESQKQWMQELIKRKLWTEPREGESVIAEPIDS